MKNTKDYYRESIGAGRNPELEKETVGYNGAHKRLTRERGSAKDYRCEVCPKQAQEWALWHGAEDQQTWLVRGKELSYSTEPWDYMPMCASHHRKYDLGAFDL